MTTHSPLIEALKELDGILQSAQISLGALAVDPDADRPKFIISPIAKDERCLQDAFQSIDEARDFIRSRIATETTEPNAAQDTKAIRAEALEEAAKLAIAKLRERKVRPSPAGQRISAAIQILESATAIRSPGDRG